MASSSSSSPSVSVTREEFNAFHKSDRALFTRLVVHLRRDIRQSLQVMSFLLYLEKSGLRILMHLIVNLVSLPDYFTNSVADEVMMCLSCLPYNTFSSFVASTGMNINSSTIPLITRMSGGYFTLEVIHQNRENILLAMKKHLNSICYPAFEDICVRAEMNNKEIAEKAIEMMKLLSINRAVRRPESSSQFFSEQQETARTRNVGAIFSEDEQSREDERTVFLTFSRGYPITEAEVHAYFTRRFGEIIEAIIMPPGEGNEQALYAKMVLHSAAMIPEIVSDEVTRTKYIINGKHVWARKYIPRSSMMTINNGAPSNGVSL